MKIYLTTVLSLLILTFCNAQSTSGTTVKDFSTLTGSWQGSLTYLDYSSGKSYTMPADLAIQRIQRTNTFIFSNIYPKEPAANATDTMTISTEGTYIDKEFVKTRHTLANGNIEIITEKSGKDGNDNKQATIRHTYTLGKTIFSIRKDVQFVGETNWINRHLYSYNRKYGR